MDFLIKDFLLGFLPEESQVKLLTTYLNDANFILADIDGDVQPEIVMLMESNNIVYLVVLDRNEANKWIISYAKPVNEVADNEEYISHIVPTKVPSSLLASFGGKWFNSDTIFCNMENLKCIALIEGFTFEAEITVYPNLWVSSAVKMLENNLAQKAKELKVSISDEIKKADGTQNPNLERGSVYWPSDTNNSGSIASEIQSILKPLMNNMPIPNFNAPPIPDIPEGPALPNPNYPIPPMPELPNLPELPNIPDNVIKSVTPSYTLNGKIGYNDILIDQQFGNIKSGSHSEILQLYGKQTTVNNYFSDMYLIIQTSNNEPNIKINLPITKGYDPKLQIVYFSGEAYRDVAVQINLTPYTDQGIPSIAYFVYSYNTGSLKMIFDSQYFNENFGGNLWVGSYYGQIFPLSYAYFQDLYNDPKSEMITIQPIVSQNYVILAYMYSILQYDYAQNGLVVTHKSVEHSSMPLTDPDTDEELRPTPGIRVPDPIPDIRVPDPIPDIKVPDPRMMYPNVDNSNQQSSTRMLKASMPSVVFSPIIAPDDVLISQKFGNVKGGSNSELIKLLGKTNSISSGFYYDIYLLIEASSNEPSIKINLPVTKGYNPTIEVLYFSGTAYKDIAVKIEPSLDHIEDGISFFIYSYNTGNLKMIFNSKQFDVAFSGQTLINNQYCQAMKLSQAYFQDLWNENVNSLITVQEARSFNAGKVIGYIYTIFSFDYNLDALVASANYLQDLDRSASRDQNAAYPSIPLLDLNKLATPDKPVLPNLQNNPPIDPNYPPINPNYPPINPNYPPIDPNYPVIPLPDKDDYASSIYPTNLSLKASVPSIVLNPDIAYDDVLIAQKFGNVKSGSNSEVVKLLGKINSVTSGFYYDIYLLIETGNNDPSIKINLPVTKGYTPSLEVIAFSGTAYEDIAVKIEPSPDHKEDGISFFIYSYNTGDLKMIFNSKQFDVEFGGPTIIHKISCQVMPLNKAYFKDLSQESLNSFITVQEVKSFDTNELIGHIYTIFNFNYDLDALLALSHYFQPLAIGEPIVPLPDIERPIISDQSGVPTMPNDPKIDHGYPIIPLPDIENNKPIGPLIQEQPNLNNPNATDNPNNSNNPNIPNNPDIPNNPPVDKPEKNPGSYVSGIKIPNNYTIFKSVLGNIRGGSRPEIVTLAAKIAQIKEYYTGLTLFIESQDVNVQPMQIILPITAGYNPTLELVNFSGEAYLDTVITIDPKGNGQFREVFIYSYNTGNLRMIFDSRDFNEQFTGAVYYANDYKVNIALSTYKKFTLNIGPNNDNAAKLYSPDGKLLAPTQGKIMPLSKIEFVKYWDEKTKNLAVIQPVVGINEQDVIGYIETIFVFNYDINALVVYDQEAFVIGSAVTPL
ncbi:MAG: hypothetical protein ATN31_09575 [Candidatus Epulonipiscioides saccharophilum]|nr:MAG: hypothetical protein ATN31_09575 [Epulopiscium sp. AS2M-Bin001]